MATTKSRLVQDYWHPAPLYERWLDTLDIPVHREYFVDDLRTLPLGPWEERECNAAIVVLAGQEGVTEARITEIPPGSTMPALKFSLDEIVYVLEGKGMCTVWAGEGRPKRSFEWQKHSLFMLPRSHFHQLSNMQGGQPTRLLHFNSLPVAMAVIPNVDYFFDNPHVEPERDMLDPELGDIYSQAQFVERDGKVGGFWMSNFFPDLKAWDKMHPMQGRGGGSASGTLTFPNTATRIGLPTMPVGVYKKAHRHGPGIVIVIPGGEGMSVMWPDGGEKLFCNWHEGSVFVPPDQWWHQHFNVGATPARYITMHPPRHPLFGSSFGYDNRGAVRKRDPESRASRGENQIEYTEEDPKVRRRFEAELAKRGVQSRMPDEVYANPNYQWEYPEEEEGAERYKLA